MAIDITLNQFKQAVKENDTRKNVLETNPGDKVKVVKPKTQTGAAIESLRLDPKSFGFALAFDMINKERKDSGLEPLYKEDLDKDETTAGREFQAAISGAGANIAEGLANLITIPVDYAFDTSFKVTVLGKPYCTPILAISPVNVLGLPCSVTNFLVTSFNFLVKLVSKA